MLTRYQLVVSTFMGASLAFAAGMQPDGKAKVYTGGEGTKVTVVKLKPQSAKQCLIAIEGSESEWDGKVLFASITNEGRRDVYKTKWHGGDSYVMTTETSWGGKRFNLHGPNRRDAINIGYDEKKSEGASATDVVNKFLGRKTAGKGTADAFDRPEEQMKENGKFLEVAKTMNEACGTTIPSEIDWKSINDDVLKEYEVGSHCGAVLTAVEKLCDDDIGKQTIKEKIKSFTCKYGGKGEIQFSGGKLVWSTTKDVPDPEDTARTYLEKKL